ncbi:hypothetical protein BO70DRAFT_4039 [Aspergillus heteromorphus CBS 117.55]|uniref:Uncharacterized protein n=1 Tax=Aspergillus heteromorphus CBS 117.55 TaxID=1448321 RepID=A0A317X6H1_9EURO|nr:uncharacterized protein BO70DRAFT_4039 [Aspergillus heteromorphus CBS 117.55]PWY92160.1 hypothetical protein BO70DRAFT_4039 [Aspergillus heteromorphus CBS 117.55]
MRGSVWWYPFAFDIRGRRWPAKYYSSTHPKRLYISNLHAKSGLLLLITFQPRHRSIIQISWAIAFRFANSSNPAMSQQATLHSNSAGRGVSLNDLWRADLPVNATASMIAESTLSKVTSRLKRERLGRWKTERRSQLLLRQTSFRVNLRF